MLKLSRALLFLLNVILVIADDATNTTDTATNTTGSTNITALPVKVLQLVVQGHPKFVQLNYTLGAIDETGSASMVVSGQIPPGKLRNCITSSIPLSSLQLRLVDDPTGNRFDNDTILYEFDAQYRNVTDGKPFVIPGLRPGGLKKDMLVYLRAEFDYNVTMCNSCITNPIKVV